MKTVVHYFPHHVTSHGGSYVMTGIDWLIVVGVCGSIVTIVIALVWWLSRPKK